MAVLGGVDANAKGPHSKGELKAANAAGCHQLGG